MRTAEVLSSRKAAKYERFDNEPPPDLNKSGQPGEASQELPAFTVAVVLGEESGRQTSGKVTYELEDVDSTEPSAITLGNQSAETEAIAPSNTADAASTGRDKGGSNSDKEKSSKDAILDDPRWRQMTPRKFFIGFCYGFMMLVRAVTNVSSAAFTYAYYIQAVALLNPFITALLSRTVLGEKKLPVGFCWAVLGCGVCALLAIYGENSAKVSDDEPGKTFAPSLGSTALGCFLQLFSVCLSSMNRVLMKWTQSEFILSEHLAAFQFGGGFLILAAFMTSMQPQEWTVLWTLVRSGGFDCALLLYFSLGCFFVATSVQIFIVRKIGPVVHSCFQPVRMVTALAGTYVLMHEPVKSTLCWVGLAGLVTVLVIYFWVQAKHAGS